MKNYKLQLALSLVAFGLGCNSKDDHKKPAPPVPQALSLDGFENPSFASLSWEKQCSGFQTFFKDYQKLYLEGVELSFGEYSCMHPSISIDSISSTIDVNFTKDGQSLSLYTYIYTKYDKGTSQFAVPSLDISRRLDSVHRIEYKPELSDRLLSENLLHLSKTLEVWVKAGDDRSAKVFGIPYNDYAMSVEKTYGADTEGLHAPNPNIQIVLLPTENEIGSGVVKFKAVDASEFQVTTSQGETKAHKLLGCSDLDCLNASAIAYSIVGPKIVLKSGTITDGNGPHTEYIGLTFTNWTL